jgi:hypothetical protein
VNKNIKIENMKKEEFTKYSDMYVKIKHKMDNIQMSLRYGLSNNDKAFLEMVSDLLKEE